MDEGQQYLDQLLKKAEESVGVPPLPKGGIPRQCLPSWIRFFFKIILLPFVHLDLAMQNVAKMLIPPPFKKTGRCKKRGNCCYYILLPETKGIVGKVFYFWYTQVHGFYLRETSPCEYEGRKVLAMGCRYLTQNRTCGQYLLRPTVCRKWPIIEHFGRPRILKGCGYEAVVKQKYAKKYPNLHVLQNDD